MERLPRRERNLMVPEPVTGEPGLFVVDATWGTIRPIQLAPEVVTVGELEVIEQLEDGLPLVDSRRRHFFEQGTIPGARSIPHPETLDRIGELDPGWPTVLFCNGPQCSATPQAIEKLLEAGYPPSSLRYYRGGMHDWLTLGLPVQPGA
jgi:rhodanese-related sulfurtransferase